MWRDLCSRDDEVQEQRECGCHAGRNRRALRNVYPHLSCRETVLALQPRNIGVSDRDCPVAFFFQDKEIVFGDFTNGAFEIPSVMKRNLDTRLLSDAQLKHIFFDLFDSTSLLIVLRSGISHASGHVDKQTTDMTDKIFLYIILPFEPE